MPTLEQLFNERALPSQGGKTAKEAYDIRNSKDIRISAADPFVNTVGMALARASRKTVGAKLSETLLEEELTGVRLIRTASMPFIYGSELPRLTLRSTTLLDTMREASNSVTGDGAGNVGGGGLLGGLIKKGRDAVLNSKFLGIPQTIIPTKVGTDERIKKILKSGEIQKNYLETLKKVREQGEGKPLGKFLKGLGGGNIKDIGKQALGSALKLGKDELRGALFGTPGKTGFNTATLIGLKNTTTNYGNISSNDPADINFTADSNGIIDAGGLRYSDTFNVKIPISEEEAAENEGLTANNLNPNKLDFVDISDEGGLGGRYSKALTDLDIPKIELFSSIHPTRKAKISDEAKKVKKDDIVNNSDSNKGARYNNSSFGIALNKKAPYEIKEEDTSVDDLDSIVLKFESVKQNKAVNFVSTITGLGESFSPGWTSNKFIGNPFNFYTYEGIERSVSFSFKIFSLNPSEHKIAWDKLNFLTSLVYPQAYEGEAGYITAPFLKLTIGDMYKRKEGFIESLSYGIDDSTPWNTEDEYESVEGKIDTKGYRLPRIINVETTFKFIETRNNTETGKYPFSLESQNETTTTQ
jgi:hypothetical protein